MAKATGLSRTMLHRGVLEQGSEASSRLPGGIRKRSGGRKKLTHMRPALAMALERLVEPTTCGDPAPLRWICRSTRQLAAALGAQGHHPISHQTVASWLDELGYSLQGNQKTHEGSGYPDRDAQFRYIHDGVEDFQNRAQPVMSVATKKKELVGDCQNGVREWHRRGEPEPVRVYNLVDPLRSADPPYLT